MAHSLKLLLNIGTPDAHRLGLKETKAGEVVSVDDDDLADEMLIRGWAVEEGKEEEGLDPRAVPSSSVTPRIGEAQVEPGKNRGDKGVDLTKPPAAAPPVTTTPTTPDVDFDAMTKEELQVHADTHHIQGVTMSQNKDEMIRTIRKAKAK